MEFTRLFLARHGEVVGHGELRFNGHTDVDITREGERQMERLGEFLRPMGIEAIYSSDLRRARKGAEIISRIIGVGYRTVPSLREINLGRWEGLTFDEVKRLYPEEADFRFRDLATYRIKGGENIMDLRERVIPALERIIQDHRGRRVLIVAHGGVNRVILAHAMGLPLENFFRIEQDYGALNVIDFFDDTPLVRLVNGGPNQTLSRSPY